MEGFDPATSFGYDVSTRDAVDTRGDAEPTVAFLAQIAGPRDALEFAVGTGRIAWPLTREPACAWTAARGPGPWWTGCASSRTGTPSR
jgi:hypothetical protein